MAPRVPRRATVVSTTRLTPHMVRVVLGGAGFDDFTAGEFTDHYVKLRLPDSEGEIRTRTYTVRAWDPERKQITVDFVVHGDTGVAGPWALKAQPGDELDLLGPGGAYTPDPEADWHLLAGDAAVIPAIAAALPRIPAGTPVQVVLEVDGPEEEQPLETPGDLTLVWLHRTKAPGEEPELLLEAVRALPRLPGRGQVFLHGEATAVRNVRKHVIAELGPDTDLRSISGYWKRRRTEEGWREDKPAWREQVEADDAIVGRA